MSADVAITAEVRRQQVDPEPVPHTDLTHSGASSHLLAVCR